ncbi:hypothetical protein GPECTOR_132g593 [Gonium pectorale]|uniref:Rieske domain-containing protein n=1 Tax=Gonium pectorale TaxID=33097 RepID=A0A150FY86_GONPE|nr:hypothetical protein GPECTOR_132g593 [Gonium pectorale]|eukprot:KXZ42581.1 hypothetical protein GPECTOR_132g593 [Gonium pectorale]
MPACTGMVGLQVTDIRPERVDAAFVWTRNWFPVAVLECLDPSRPHPFKLMGRDLVLWRDGSGSWRAFADACPHRLAPLSEGRVEKDGTLLCAYHGWRFDSAGKCTSLPQMESKEAEHKACSNPRSCATSYPTREAQGLLWVWGEPGAMGELESKQKPPALIPEMEELPAERLQPMPWFFRDLPYSHDFFIENVTDPAHVTVSHHNVAGNRYAPDQYVTVDELRPASATGGFKYSVKILIKDTAGKLPRGLAFFAAPMPTWLAHTTASMFLHQDQVFLHAQERTVAARGSGAHGAKYFMPAPADNMTTAFRKWLGSMAGGGIPYAGSSALPPTDPLTSKDALFDTYHTHTAQCAICKPALKNLQTARAAAVAAAFAALGTAALVLAVTAAAKAAALAAAGAAASSAATSALLSPPPLASLVAAALAALLGGVTVVIDKLIGMMHRYEYSHADNH